MLWNVNTYIPRRAAILLSSKRTQHIAHFGHVIVFCCLSNTEALTSVFCGILPQPKQKQQIAYNIISFVLLVVYNCCENTAHMGRISLLRGCGCVRTPSRRKEGVQQQPTSLGAPIVGECAEGVEGGSQRVPIALSVVHEQPSQPCDHPRTPFTALWKTRAQRFRAGDHLAGVAGGEARIASLVQGGSRDR